jgi:hypothetical protein
VSGFGQFVERMAFLLPSDNQDGRAGAVGAGLFGLFGPDGGAEDDGGAPAAFALVRWPRETAMGMSSADFREDRRPARDVRTQMGAYTGAS